MKSKRLKRRLTRKILRSILREEEVSLKSPSKKYAPFTRYQGDSDCRTTISRNE